MPKLPVVSRDGDVCLHVLDCDQFCCCSQLLIPFAETVAKTGMILLAGEVTSRATVDYQKIVRDTIRQIGYDDSSKGVLWMFSRNS